MRRPTTHIQAELLICSANFVTDIGKDLKPNS
jgi:hypothetical protein